MTQRSFAHLHLHTEFSLLDAMNRTQELMPKLAKMGMPAVAMTDHGNMFGAIKFYDAARAAGVKPIMGCEMYITPGSRHQKEAVNGRRPRTHHLVLLAKDMEGYRNLTKLVSIGFMEGFYYAPRIDKEVLREHSKGLICTSACISGEVAYWLLQNDYEKAKEIAIEHAQIMGDGNYYLEIQNHGIPEQELVLEGLVSLSKETGLPLVATNDCHYLDECDHKPHDVLQCIQGGKSLDDPSRKRYYGTKFYTKSAEEMWELFADHEESVKHTLEIAERCNVEFEFGKYVMPDYEIPKTHTIDSFFEQICKEGLKDRLEELGIDDPARQTEYEQRLDYEMGVIKDMGFPGYFLITWDFVKYARDKGIPVGPGRGSAAGSLVAYALRITDIDPLKFNLIFERFLNPERISMPDIDIDFCQDRREEVIEYVRNHYGSEKVCQIITFNTMGSKSIIKDVGRALEADYKDLNALTKLIPVVQGRALSLDEAFEREPELPKLCKATPKLQDVVDAARRLEGMPRHVSVHAAGVVITDKPLTNYLPLYQKSETEVTTQFPMEDVERLGLLKMDFLGLRTLTVIRNTLDMLEKGTGKTIDIDAIPLDDKKTLKLLSAGKTEAIFQFESSGMQDLLKKCGVDRFEDLIALNSMYRPGPMQMIPEYIARKHGRSPVTYEDQRLEPILKETYGIMVYQEQVMKIANVLAGFSLGQADKLRKIMGKKKVELVAGERGPFVEGCLSNGVERHTAERIFDQMAEFASYGFNKSHAAAYSYVAWQTAYLKAHYPQYFMAAMLNSYLDSTSHVVQYINECREMGIEILPPSINKCHADFTVEGDKIYFGLGAVKGLGLGAIEKIIAARDAEGPFKSVFDLCERVESGAINKKVLEGLIKSGALDTDNANRAQMMEVIDKATDIAARRKRDAESGQASLFDMGGLGEVEEVETSYEYPAMPEFSKRKLLEMEKESIGFYVSGHPLADYRREVKRYTHYDTSQLADLSDGMKLDLAGLLGKLQRKTDKRGNRYGIVTLEDLNGSVQAMLNADLLEKHGMELQEDEPVILSGRLDIRDDRLSIRVDSIKKLKAIRERCKCLALRIEAVTAEEDTLKRLKAVLNRHKGECEVRFHLSVPRGDNGDRLNVVTTSPYKIKPTEAFVTAVEELLGDGSIEFQRGG